MSQFKPGDRVMAIASGKWVEAEGKRTFKVSSYGEGTYRGETVPEGDAVRDMPVQCMAVMLHEEGVPNPTIDLDSGEVVYGCECWWGGIAAARKNLKMDDPNTVVSLELPSAHREEVRKAYKAHQEKETN